MTTPRDSYAWNYRELVTLLNRSESLAEVGLESLTVCMINAQESYHLAILTPYLLINLMINYVLESKHHTCKRDYDSIGCFQEFYPGELLLNDRDNIDWNNIVPYMHRCVSKYLHFILSVFSVSFLILQTCFHVLIRGGSQVCGVVRLLGTIGIETIEQ